MVKYEILGFEDENSYIDYFFETLLPTNRTYDYYVDWEKVKGKVFKCLNEISLLNALTKVVEEERESKLAELILKYPEVLQVIPIIIAVREKKVLVLEVGDKLFYKEFKFNKNPKKEEVRNIIHFCKKTGILDLFGEINDLYAYLLGVEVGLDTNARKNRSGTYFEHFVGLLLKKKLKNLEGYSLSEEDNSIKLKRNKRSDFIIYKNKVPKIILECNFYGSNGSKPREVASSYIDLDYKCKDENITLIWVTDGPGWPTMRSTIENTFKEIDFPMNYQILDETFNLIIDSI